MDKYNSVMKAGVGWGVGGREQRWGEMGDIYHTVNNENKFKNWET